MRTRNSEVLESFVAYCKANPSQRFWQALRNWSSYNFIYVSDLGVGNKIQDTFYWEGKDK